jgi:hypothetical protein
LIDYGYTALNSPFQAYDITESTSVIQPAVGERQYAKIQFGSGGLQGYFIEDQCILGDPDDISN